MDILVICIVGFVMLIWMVYQLSQLEQIKEQSKLQTKLLEDNLKVNKIISHKMGKNDLDEIEGLSIKQHKPVS